MDYRYLDRIKIYLDDCCTPIAECHFSDGNVSKVYWNDIQERKEILLCINGYTLFYDERPKVDWE